MPGLAVSINPLLHKCCNSECAIKASIIAVFRELIGSLFCSALRSLTELCFPLPGFIVLPPRPRAVLWSALFPCPFVQGHNNMRREKKSMTTTDPTHATASGRTSPANFSSQFSEALWSVKSECRETYTFVFAASSASRRQTEKEGNSHMSANVV